jgi:hypothetical protein
MFLTDRGAGVTACLLNAGKFDKDIVEADPGYYNDGVKTVAIPCTEQALLCVGLYSVIADLQFIGLFANKEIAETQE